jgi:hypothetical protein
MQMILNPEQTHEHCRGFALPKSFVDAGNTAARLNSELADVKRQNSKREKTTFENASPEKSPAKFICERGYREERSKADLSSSEEVERGGRYPTGDMHLSCGIPV